MEKIFCKHEYVLVGDIKHLRYDYDGQQVLYGVYVCKKCNAKINRKFLGHMSGHLFEQNSKIK